MTRWLQRWIARWQAWQAVKALQPYRLRLHAYETFVKAPVIKRVKG